MSLGLKCRLADLGFVTALLLLAADTLVFWPGSPRFLDPFRARAIAAALPPFVTPVGLFVNQPAALLNGVASESPPRVSSATCAMNFASTRFPIVFSTIFKAGNSDTPLLTNVPSVRANAATAWSLVPGTIRSSALP